MRHLPYPIWSCERPELLEELGGQPGGTTTVELRFCHDAACFLLRHILRGGDSYLSEPYLNSDGTIDTTLEAPADGGRLAGDLLAWILGWETRVEVLGPPELRAHWQRERHKAVVGAGNEAGPFAAEGAA